MLTIHREKQPDKIIRMGHGTIDVLVPVVHAEVVNKDGDLTLQLRQPAAAPIPDSPPEPVKNKRGRPKKMAEEKKLGHETGVKKIHQEDAGKQGPVGTGAENPPASSPSEDVAIGNKEGEGNA